MKLNEQMKNWPWKRITLGAAIISSIAASTSFGTFAYFSSEKTTQTAFAAGKLEIELGETKATFSAKENLAFLPGVRFENELVVENSSDSAVKYALKASKASGDDVVYDQLMVEIRNGDQVIYHGKVKQLTQANVVVPDLEKGASHALHYTVYLPESAGNEVQQKTAEVDFGFLATQKENGEYFAQSGPVMTLSPEQFTGSNLEATLKVIEDAVEGTTFILGEGEYTVPANLELKNKIAFKADKGKEGKVKLRASGGSEDAILVLHNASVDGLAFLNGTGSALVAGSHVSIVNCTFEGSFEAAVRNAKKGEISRDKDGKENDKDYESLSEITLKNNKFVGATQGILLDEEVKAVMIMENTFEQVAKGLSVKNTLDPISKDGKIQIPKDQLPKDINIPGLDKKDSASKKRSEVQVVKNDFSKVTEIAVDSEGVRIGDGIEGFSENGGPLALHLHQLDIYLEENTYPAKAK